MYYELVTYRYMMKDYKEYIIDTTFILKDALQKMDKIGTKTLVVSNTDGILLGILSDGDIRRSILDDNDLHKSVKYVMNKNPYSVNDDYDINFLKNEVIRREIQLVPVIDSAGKVLEIILLKDLFLTEKIKYPQMDLPVVIMAGGKGTRLDPFTRILPKPLIPINDKPIIEIIMDEYAKFGMKDFYISLNHKGKMIKAYLEDHNNDYSFSYIFEDKPLGTAGALKYLERKLTSAFFVSNCDIIIKTDYSKIYEFHKQGEYALTLIGSIQHYTIPYGICEIENGGILKKINEKPEQDFIVNTGMYLLEPKVLKEIPENEFFHITHLIEKLQYNGYKVGVYPVSEKSWIDVGQWEEYKVSIKNLEI